MSKTDFQDSGCGGHLGFLINTILAHFNPKSCCYRASVGSNRPKVWEEMSKIDFFKMAVVAAILDFRSAQLELFCVY